jgi:hypothetical protein
MRSVSFVLGALATLGTGACGDEQTTAGPPFSGSSSRPSRSAATNPTRPAEARRKQGARPTPIRAPGRGKPPVPLQKQDRPPKRTKLATGRPDCRMATKDQYSFPAGVLFPRVPDSEVDGGLRGWYSTALRRMKEPSLSCGQVGGESYRLLVLPTWAPPVAVRVMLKETRATLTVAMLSGAGGYDPGRLRVKVRRQLFTAEHRELRLALSALRLWSTPTRDDERFGADGTRWILEGRSAQAYHVVDRWFPEAGPFRDVADLLTRLAGLRPPYRRP